MANYNALIEKNNQLWSTAEFHPDMEGHAATVAQRACASKGKAIYQELETETGVPWWVIAVIHYREASFDFSKSLAQGDPWNKPSIHIPKRRGPFRSFKEAAIDALVKCAPFASRWKDWSPGGALTLLELYNGTGYERHGIPSPYVWSGTQHYRHGKYVRDGKYKDLVVDTQLGCAIIIHEMQKLDDSILSEAQGGPDPEEYPDPQAAEPVSFIEQVGEAAPQAKSLFKSKIAWLQGTAATAGVGAVSSDDTIWTELATLMHKPTFWFAVVLLVCVGLTLFYRWYDHGRGK